MSYDFPSLQERMGGWTYVTRQDSSGMSSSDWSVCRTQCSNCMKLRQVTGPLDNQLSSLCAHNTVRQGRDV